MPLSARCLCHLTCGCTSPCISATFQQCVGVAAAYVKLLQQRSSYEYSPACACSLRSTPFAQENAQCGLAPSSGHNCPTRGRRSHCSGSHVSRGRCNCWRATRRWYNPNPLPLNLAALRKASASPGSHWEGLRGWTPLVASGEAEAGAVVGSDN